MNTIGIVCADEAVLNDIYLAQKEAYGEYASEYTSRIGVRFANEDAVSAVGEELSRAIGEKLEAFGEASPGVLRYTLDTKWEALHNVLDMYGTFLFLGILLGFVCLFSTILIIYYKQISEGYEDRERFQIMEKIGMESQEVKKTIGDPHGLCLPDPAEAAADPDAVEHDALCELYPDHPGGLWPRVHGRVSSDRPNVLQDRALSEKPPGPRAARSLWEG